MTHWARRLRCATIPRSPVVGLYVGVGVVDGWPVIHRVDNDLAVEVLQRQLGAAAERGQRDDDVGLAGERVRVDGLRPGDHELELQLKGADAR